MPWVLAKDESQKPRLAEVLYNLCEVLRITAILLSPAMPSTSRRIFEQIGADEQYRTWDSIVTAPETYAMKKGEVIFPRIDLEKELASLEKEQTEKMVQKADIKEEKTAPAKANTQADAGIDTGIITYDDFMKTSLRVAKVLDCVPVEKSDKLLKLTLDVGQETRQVVSGISKWYKPEQLIGKKVIMVANLKPAKLRGVESQGMILAADNGEDDVRVVFMDDDINPGSVVR
jgi:methionyl-tRNA synthetase